MILFRILTPKLNWAEQYIIVYLILVYSTKESCLLLERISEVLRLQDFQIGAKTVPHPHSTG